MVDDVCAVHVKAAFVEICGFKSTVPVEGYLVAGSLVHQHTEGEVGGSGHVEVDEHVGSVVQILLFFIFLCCMIIVVFCIVLDFWRFVTDPSEKITVGYGVRTSRIVFYERTFVWCHVNIEYNAVWATGDIAVAGAVYCAIE